MGSPRVIINGVYRSRLCLYSSFLATPILRKRTYLLMRKHILLLIALVTFASSGFAQRSEPQETKSQFGRRAAKIPQSAADTGVQFNEARMNEEAAKYFYDLRTSGEVKDISLIEKIGYEEFKKLRGAVALKQQSIPVWQPIGGDQDGHNSGRSRSMAFKGTNTVYIAYAQGGIWKTDNINDPQPTWVCLTDKLESIAFGSIVADPRNGDIVYAGTGESEGGFSTPPGAGLFKTTDGGLNWFKILGTDTLGTRCSEIAINPLNPDILYVATGTTKAGVKGGVVKSTDGGATWQVSTLTSFLPFDIDIDPVDTARIYTSGTGKIYRSTNSGATWQQLPTSSGLPSGASRIELAIAPSSPNIVYASMGRSNGSTLGLWRSTDRGDTWSTLSPTTPPAANWHGQQQQYATGIAVHATKPDQVFLGGLDLYRTNDGGKTFTAALSDWRARVEEKNYSHADVHGMYFINNTLYVNTDGGLTITKNSGAQPYNTAINKGIPTLQFVNVDADRDFTYAIGGCQDNGTNIAGVNDNQFKQTRGGDGGYVQISQAAPNVCYSQYVYGVMFKSQQGGADNSWEAMDAPFENQAPFYMPFDFDESGVYGLAAANSLYATQSGGMGSGAWVKSTPTISTASAVLVYSPDPSFMWAADGASFYRSNDAGSSFTKGTNPPGASTITGIVVDPSNKLNVWICCQGVGTSNKHVYKSVDGGQTFTGLPNFPNIGCNWIARQHGTGGLFVATDKGVVYSKDEGQSWFALEEGLPNVQVLTIRVRGGNEQYLLAGTYGRGMFKLDISNLTSVDEPKTAPSASVVTLHAVSPNPITGGNGTVNFSLSKSTIVTATLYDVLGRTVKVLAKSPFGEGKHSLNFTTNELPSGAYIISIAADGVAKTQRIVIE